MPTFNTFCEQLSREKDKLIQMGSLTSSSSKNQALIANQQKSQRQGKPPSRGSKALKVDLKIKSPLLLLHPNNNLKGRKVVRLVLFVEKMGTWNLIALLRWKH